VSIAGHYEFSIDTMDSWGKIYSFICILVSEIFGINPIFCKLFAIFSQGCFYLVKDLFKPLSFVIRDTVFWGRTRICKLNANWSRINALLRPLFLNTLTLCSQFCISYCVWFSITLLSKSNSNDIISYYYAFLVTSYWTEEVTV
jgi:hypothetical protein